MNRTPSLPLPMIITLGVLLLLPAIAFKACSPATSTVVTTPPPAESSGIVAAGFVPNKRGYITAEQVETFINVRRRTRALRDQKIARKQSVENVDIDAAIELGVDVAEYKWVKKQVRKVQDSTKRFKSNGAVQANYQQLNARSGDLRAVGERLPTYKEFWARSSDAEKWNAAQKAEKLDTASMTHPDFNTTTQHKSWQELAREERERRRTHVAPPSVLIQEQQSHAALQQLIQSQPAP